MRIVARALTGRRDLDQLQHGHRALPGLAAAGAAVGHDGGGDLIADGEHGVEGGHRLLEDHGDPRAAHAAHRLGVLGEQVLALEEHATGGHPPGRRHQPHDGQRGDALSAAALPHEPENLTAPDGEAHAVHGAEHALRRREMGLEALHVEERRHVRP